MNNVQILHPRQFAERLRRIVQAVDGLKKIDVCVGFPKEKAPAAGDQTTMAGVATIAAINEATRPFLETGIRVNAKTIRAAQYKAVEKVIDGANPIDAAAIVGEVAAAKVKGFIVSGPHLANKPSTIKKKKSSKPLIDTAQMKNSVTFSIRRRP